MSQLQGELKLVTNPFTIYENFPNQKTAKFTIDQRGFRETSTSYNFNDHSKQRIFILGASAAFGSGLNSNDETLAAHLEKIIPNSMVVNAGVIGYTSTQELLSLITKVVDYRPDIVILYEGCNDFASLLNLKREECKLNTCHNLFFNSIYTEFEMLNDTNKFKRISKNFINGFLPLTSDFLKQVRLANYTKDFRIDEIAEADAARLFAVNVRKMRNFLQGTEVKFFPFLQVSSDYLFADDDNYSKSMKGFMQNEIRQLEDLKVPYVNLNENQNSFGKEDFMDSVHLTSRGYQKTAELIAKEIVK